MHLFLVFIVAVSLSMDAFSLSLVYGTFGMSSKEKFLLSSITGLFHFFMPFLGFLVGNFIFDFVKIDSNIIVAVILSFIGFQMLFSSFKGEVQDRLMNLYEYFMFALAVSIDSFSVGITLSGSDDIILGPLMFAFSSFIFTYLGLYLGGKTYELFGKISTFIGGLVLIIIGFCHLF